MIALLLIMFRVSQGTAWKADTEYVFTTMGTALERNMAPSGDNAYVGPSFRAGSDSRMTQFDSSATVNTSTVGDSEKRVDV